MSDFDVGRSVRSSVKQSVGRWSIYDSAYDSVRWSAYSLVKGPVKQSIWQSIRLPVEWSVWSKMNERF